MRLENKVAIVTGSTSGIGLATAKLFAKEGAKVVIAARKKDIADKIIEEIKADGGEAIFVHLEVTDVEEWKNVVKETKERYGKINILVNNAGTNALCAFPNIDLEEWNKIMDIDVTGPMIGIQLCAPIMKESGGGSIVNIGSLGGMYGTFSTAYSTAKWALRGLSASAAYTYGRWGIRSNIIHPGFIEDTNLTKAIAEKQSENASGTGNPLADLATIGRAGKAKEIAEAALFLASDESSYITGHDMPVDGGLHGAGIYAVSRPMAEAIINGK